MDDVRSIDVSKLFDFGNVFDIDITDITKQAVEDFKEVVRAKVIDIHKTYVAHAETNRQMGRFNTAIALAKAAEYMLEEFEPLFHNASSISQDPTDKPHSDWNDDWFF
jgi:hypothetical protein